MPRSNPLCPVTTPLVVAGLGNPGSKYANTRHNAGYLTLNQLAEEPPLAFRRRFFSSYYEAKIDSGDLKRPLYAVRYSGYMNNSGQMTHRLLRRFRIEPTDLIVVVDNMDLPPGALRLKKGGGDAGHNGLKSLISHLGTSNFLRLYIGIGRPKRGQSVVDHVLGIPEEEDRTAIYRACINGAKAIRSLASNPFEKVAEEFNRRGS